MDPVMIIFIGIVLACAWLIIIDDYRRYQDYRADNKIFETVEEFRNDFA